MLIWFQKHTVEGRLPALDRAYRERVAGSASPGTTVEIHTLPAATYDTGLPERLVRSGGIESLFAGYFAAQAVLAERSGADAFIIGTSQDPGLLAARSLVDIPVVGYGETAAHVASMLAPTFTFVGFIPELEEPIRENLTRMGFAQRVTPFAYTEAGPETIAEAFAGRPGPFLEAFAAAARRAIAAGAQVLIPGEGLPNEILVDAGVDQIDGAPVLDANGLVVRFAEFMALARSEGLITRPQVGYHHHRPPQGEVDRLLGLFAPRSSDW